MSERGASRESLEFGVFRCLGWSWSWSVYSITTFIREITPLLQIWQFAHLRSTTCSLQGLIKLHAKEHTNNPVQGRRLSAFRIPPPKLAKGVGWDCCAFAKQELFARNEAASKEKLSDLRTLSDFKKGLLHFRGDQGSIILAHSKQLEM